MSATAGQKMLNAAGQKILKSDGSALLSNGAGDDCCCCPDGKKCFQEWIASWDCATSSWSGPVTDNRLCLATNTSTAWAKISGDSSGCEYRKYVPYDPVQCCSVNGDCDSSLGDTATPDLPFAGGTPTDCDCPTATDCPNCDPGITPLTYTITFDGVENAISKCAGECSNGSFQGGTGTLSTYTLTQDPDHACQWIFRGSGPSFIRYPESGDCTGPSTTYSSIFIVLKAVAGGHFTISVVDESVDYGVGLSGIWFEASTDADDCCSALSFSNLATDYDCGDHIAINGTAVATPSC